MHTYECVVMGDGGGIWGGILSSKVYMYWKYWIRQHYTGFIY